MSYKEQNIEIAKSVLIKFGLRRFLTAEVSFNDTNTISINGVLTF